MYIKWMSALSVMKYGDLDNFLYDKKLKVSITMFNLRSAAMDNLPCAVFLIDEETEKHYILETPIFSSITKIKLDKNATP